ncbi:MAG: malonic semialdehyde reductase [Rhodospirillales bacterium 20-60-12]|nr:MAG: malonic semialdehyde reductase [Rhodospirillales bacterium 20-60-12]HQT66739.1 malonic semialdehyde reductase [Acetobacteraceae bacterium]HQU02209.1 malonic semialdehyde reductase [Acetobacteraceae bacterium]
MLDDTALDALFGHARTKNAWTNQVVPEALLHQLYDLVKLGPTSANCSPARFVFVQNQSGKDKLKQALSPGNVDKTMAAPVTVIVAHDPLFYDHLPRLFPHADAKSWFSGNPDLASETAFRNSTLQGGYLIMAARALGLDCGPMSGFDKAKLDQLFFNENGWKSNFLINLGYGTPDDPFPRGPKLDFAEACSFA